MKLYQTSANCFEDAHNELILLPLPWLKSSNIRYWPEKQTVDEDFMKIYPNPAKNVVIIEVRLMEEPLDAVIEIVDNQGIVLKAYNIKSQIEYLVVPLSDFPPGNIFNNLIIHKQVIETQKLVIIK